MKRIACCLCLIGVFVAELRPPLALAWAAAEAKQYLPLVMQLAPRFLWTAPCDPRIDAPGCPDAGALDTPGELYGVVNSLSATIEYALPKSVAHLRQYDVVIADYCGELYAQGLTPLLTQYVAAGGSVFVLGDESCIVGGDHQGNVSAGRAANALIAPLGLAFTEDDDVAFQFSDTVLPHPVTVGVTTVYAFRHAYLEVTGPAQTVATMGGRAFIGVSDAAGTVIAVPDVGFHWGNSFQRVSESENFVLWRNALLWLMTQSRAKRTP